MLGYCEYQDDNEGFNTKHLFHIDCDWRLPKMVVMAGPESRILVVILDLVRVRRRIKLVMQCD